MEDLLQRQINKNCKIALPDGLKDLMSDISREVLRAQPADLYKFIADYLAALLFTRENLRVAARLCCDICKSSCCPELAEELKLLELNDDDIVSLVEYINEFFEKDNVNEAKLLNHVIKKYGITEEMLPHFQTAIRNAFLRHQAAHKTLVSFSDENAEEDDEAMRAARHTLRLFRETQPSEDTYQIMSTKIQAAYKAYGLRKKLSLDYEPEPQEQLINEEDTFANKIAMLESTQKKTDETEPGYNTCHGVVSLLSLAGSWVHLPKHTPYCAFDSKNTISINNDDNKDTATDGYQQEYYTEEKMERKKDKKISFSDISPQDIAQVTEDDTISNEADIINDFVKIVDDDVLSDDDNLDGDESTSKLAVKCKSYIHDRSQIPGEIESLISSVEPS